MEHYIKDGDGSSRGTDSRRQSLITLTGLHPQIHVIGIVFNPVTFGGRSVGRMRHALELLDAKGVEYVYRETACEGDAVRISAELADSCDVIVAAGGDGTVYEVVNGVYDKDVAIMVFTYGSGTARRGKKMSMQGLMTTSAGVFDGLLLVWKLYRKFKK